MAKKLILHLKDDGGADYQQEVSLHPGGRLIIGSTGISSVPFGGYTNFANLPGASAAAGSDDQLLRIGTGTEVIARAARGGVNLKSQATTPAAGDNVLLFPITTTSAMNALTQTSPRLEAVVCFNTPTAMFASVGLDENAASNAVDPSGTAGDGAAFLFLPTGPGTTYTAVDTALGQPSVTSITRDGTVGTVTTATAHGLAAGDHTTITGATQPYYNGSFVVLSVPSVTTFTIGLTGGSQTGSIKTGSTTSGSAVVTALAGTVGLSVGDPVTGAGIPAATTILTVDSPTQITLSANATATGTLVVLTFATNETGTALVNAYSNWICHQKVAGADVYYKTNVAVVAAADYKLVIDFNSGIVPRYFINDVLVATGTAGTTAKNLGVNIGLQLTATPGGQKDMDVRYVSVGQQKVG